jgi:hypothetical protein
MKLLEIFAEDEVEKYLEKCDNARKNNILSYRYPRHSHKQHKQNERFIENYSRAFFIDM